MRVHSIVRPEEVQFLQNKKLVSFDIKEETNEDGELIYSYSLLKLPVDYTDLHIQDAITGYREKNKVLSITPRQARLQLLKEGILDNLETLLKSNRDWEIEWEYSIEVARNSPIINAIKEAISLTDVDIDRMFLEASKL
jgi:hypothetical protein